MLWRSVGLDLLIGAVIVTVWYFIGLQLNRRRSMTILYWIDDAIQGTARICALEWKSASQFLVRLRFPENHFRNAVLHVRLHPWELPLRWLAVRLGRHSETLTFEADLPAPPSFNMQVCEQRYTTLSRSEEKRSEHFQTERLGPFVLTTRPDWQQNIVNMMESLSCSDHCEFLDVSFDPNSPNFRAVMRLESFRPGAEYRATIFDTMRELATSASPSRT